jgi:amino acid transporter
VSNTEAAGSAQAEVPIFSRRATGLVRQVSLVQQIAFNLASSNALGLGLVFFLSVVVLFPRANIYIALLIAGVMSFFVWTTFALLGSAIPRVGGDYTINSRILPPWLALGGNIGAFMGGLFGVPIFGYFMATLALSPALAVIGGVTGNSTLTSWSQDFSSTNQTTVFITTLVIVGVVSLLAYLGTGLIMRVATTMVVIAGIGFAIDLVILLFTGNAQFSSTVDQVAGAGAYAKTIAAGAAAGLYPDKGGYDFTNTIGAVYYSLTITIYIYWGVYVASEFKGAGRRQRMLGAIWGAGIGNLLVLLLAIAVFMNTVGYDFFVAAFGGNFSAPGASTAVGNAGYVYFAALVASQPIAVTLLSLAFLGWFMPACFTQVAMVTRAIMTWSFDGLLPRVFSKVDDRTHTPGVAILTTALLSIPLAAWISYSTNFFQYFAIAAVSAYPSLVLVGIAAMLIKRRRSDLYRGSSAEWRLGGIEVLPIVGFLCALVGAAAIALLFIFRANVGLIYPIPAAIYLVAMFALAAAWWYGARAVRRGQGVDLALAYKVIPPD